MITLTLLVNYFFLMYADGAILSFNIEDFPLQSRESAINNELKKVNT